MTMTMTATMSITDDLFALDANTMYDDDSMGDDTCVDCGDDIFDCQPETCYIAQVSAETPDDGFGTGFDLYGYATVDALHDAQAYRN